MKLALTQIKSAEALLHSAWRTLYLQDRRPGSSPGRHPARLLNFSAEFPPLPPVKKKSRN